jgi:DNA-binding NarL/FixJ family response regulator
VNPQRSLCVMVVDDHDVLHWGFRVLLTRQSWVQRCLAAHSSAEALDLARRYEPHVALVDMCLGEESGAELCERLTKTVERTRVVLMSGVGTVSPGAAKAVGACAFVSKVWNADEISNTVRLVGQGLTVFPPEPKRPAELLSEREREVLKLLAVGATNREIADDLYLSPHTIKDHTTGLYRKLKARNRADAVVRAQRLGLLT